MHGARVTAAARFRLTRLLRRLQATRAAARAAAAAAQRTAPRTRTAPPQRPRWWRRTGATRWKTLPRWPPPPRPCQPCWPCQPWHSTTDNGDNAGGNWLNVDSRVIAPFFLFFFSPLFFVFNRLKAAVEQAASQAAGAPGLSGVRFRIESSHAS